MNAELIARLNRARALTMDNPEAQDEIDAAILDIAALSATPQAAQVPVEKLGDTCIDGGACHHRCATLCYRRQHCEHFSDYSGPWRYSEPQAAQVPAAWVAMVTELVRHIEGETCTHEETYRGGAIWEICRECGAKWADDEGGKPEFTWPACVEAANAMLASAQPQAAQVPEGLTPRHWRLIDFALWRLIRAAYDRAEAAVQDKAGRFYSPSALEAFMRDATDAEAARGIVSAAIKANGWDAAAQAQGVG